MKNRLIIIVLILITFQFLKSQDYEPLQQTFSIDTGNGTPQTMYISADLPFFQQRKPFFDWQWSSGRKMTKALRMNGGFTNDHESPYIMHDSIQCVILAYPVECAAGDKAPLQAPAIQYEPTLKLNDTMPWEFKTNIHDSTNPVFGFRYYNFLSSESVVTSNRVTLNSGIRNIEQNFIYNSSEV